MNVARTLFDTEDYLPKKESIPPTRSENILSVIAHYKTYFPRACPKPTTKSLYWGKISARFNEGYSVDDCKRAIDGCCNDEWHKKVTKHDLLYIFRNDEKVTKFMLLADKQSHVEVVSEEAIRTSELLCLDINIPFTSEMNEIAIKHIAGEIPLEILDDAATATNRMERNNKLSFFISVVKRSMQNDNS
tara:strand:+ start:874 stop:1440 length:567 start_codon:yes stop_codon:yes gene_type:complete